MQEEDPKKKKKIPKVVAPKNYGDTVRVGSIAIRKIHPPKGYAKKKPQKIVAPKNYGDVVRVGSMTIKKVHPRGGTK